MYFIGLTMAVVVLTAPPVQASVPVASDSTAIRAVVEAFFHAVETGKKDSALALMSAEWRAEEMRWRRSFTSALFDQGWKITSREYSEFEIFGDSAVVRVHTTMVSSDGEEDREPMRFYLVRSGERWIISRLS